MRIVGIIMLFLAISGIGFLLSFLYSQRVKKLESAMKYIQRITEQMRHSGQELPQILSITENDIFIQNGAWRGTEGLKKDDRKALDSFILSLGTTDLEGQLKNAAAHISELYTLTLEAKKERDEYSKLFISLGFLCGAFVCILLI